MLLHMAAISLTRRLEGLALSSRWLFLNMVVAFDRSPVDMFDELSDKALDWKKHRYLE